MTQPGDSSGSRPAGPEGTSVSAPTSSSFALSGSTSASGAHDPKPATPRLKPGDRIGGCAVTRFIAFGGMGEVYEGKHETLDRRVAIKLIREKYADDPKYRARFLREAKAAARFTNPHVAIVFDAGEQGERLYVILEYIEGEDVGKRVARLGMLAPAEALRVVSDVARGLAVAHAQGVVHRDVKPTNIMVTSDGAAKLMDFGLVRIMHASDLEKTEAGSVIGTPQYMSAEQWQGRDLDGRTDLYSLGVTLYEMLCGKLPVSGSTLGQICTQTSAHQLVPLRQRHPGLDPEFYALVDWLLAPMDQRCPDAKSLIERVERIQRRGAESRADVFEVSKKLFLSPGTEGEAGAPRTARSNLFWAAAACVPLAALVALAFYLWPTQLRSEPPAIEDEAKFESVSLAVLPPIQLDWIVAGQRRSGGAWEQVDLIKEARLGSGDQFQMRIRPNQDCYLYVLWMQSQGEPLLLYPGTGDPKASRVERGKEVCLPPGDDAWYKLDQNLGKETLCVAASYEPIESVTRLLNQVFTASRGAKEPPDNAAWSNALKEIAAAPDPKGHTIGEHRGLAGVTTSKPVKVKLPDGKIEEYLSESIVGKAGLVRKLTVEHR